jgi:SAM-dependent methyltransferase
MNIDQIRREFRTPAAADYPELQGYSRTAIYEGKMGPGGLYLAAQMSRRMHLSAGQRVLNLGCGGGATSVFLAKKFGVFVVALELYLSATEKYRRFQQHGVEDRVVPLNLDITRELPFAHDYFDAIFCMDSVHYYGGTLAFWAHLLPHLKQGGGLCIGSPCFNAEFSTQALQELPLVYDDGTDLWSGEFSRYHSPPWWADLLQQTGALDVKESRELEDGVIYWEDDALHNLEVGGSPEKEEKEADQITFRREGMPYLTHFVLYAEKRVPSR